ncbi:hypothetical protein GEV33_005857 [Tenebrio molitor]|uniref:Uncharacterized protein n=1 Tax=Tenebrio molitor TaxID=7067 RepID=A0A8J6HLN7_TENMO|nr:hypothetical protein GEV33_005857 [Tenebrio molitor]
MADSKRKTLKDLARYELLLDSGSSARDSPVVGSMTLVKEALIRRDVSVGILLRRLPSRIGLPPRVRQHLLHTKTPPNLPL